MNAETVRTIQLRKDESFHIDAQVVLIRSVRWSEAIQRYVIEYELGRCEQSDGKVRDDPDS